MVPTDSSTCALGADDASDNTRRTNRHSGYPVPDKLHLDRRAGGLAEQGAEGGHGEDLLNTRAVAAWFGISVQWFEIARSKGFGPPFVRLAPNCIRYRRDAVVAWLREREVKSTAEYDAPTRRLGRPLGSRVIVGRVVPPQQEE